MELLKDDVKVVQLVFYSGLYLVGKLDMKLAGSMVEMTES
jgi:hypothetical protein